jgi:hypothetical protein
VNGAAVLGYSYNGLLNDGAVGLLVRDGTGSFDSFSVRGNDPAYLSPSSGLRADSFGQNAAVAPVSAAQLQAALTAAGERLAAAGWLGLKPLDLAGITVALDDLPGLRLAEARGRDLIVLDVNAAGHGWFVDSTPRDDAEFRLALGGLIGAATGSPAHGRIDLVSALAHELAHLAGAEHAPSGVGVMAETLGAGLRSLPADGDSPQAVDAPPAFVMEMRGELAALPALPAGAPLLVFDAVTGQFSVEHGAPPLAAASSTPNRVSDDTPAADEHAGDRFPRPFPGALGNGGVASWPAAIADLFDFQDGTLNHRSQAAEPARGGVQGVFWNRDEVAGSLLKKLDRSSVLADLPIFSLLS